MLYCDKCKIQIRTENKYCPLCHAPLQGDGGESIFPPLRSKGSISAAFLNYFTFFCIAAADISIALTSIISDIKSLNFFILITILSFWIVIFVAVKKRRNLFKNILWQFVLISVCSICWDVFTGWNRWSVNFVIPSTLVVAMISMTAISIIRGLYLTYYIIYFILAGLFGLIPVFFLFFTDIITISYPSIICSSLSFLELAVFFVFYRKNLLDEIYKKLHF